MKSFSVQLSELMNKKKNPELSLSPKSILKNKKIKKRMILYG